MLWTRNLTSPVREHQFLKIVSYAGAPLVCASVTGFAHEVTTTAAQMAAGVAIGVCMAIALLVIGPRASRQPAGV